MDRQKLQATLQTLKTSAAVQVAFVLDGHGALVAWAGKSPGFSPVGQFPSQTEPTELVNLYLTTVGTHYVGVLFKDDGEVDAVRDIIEEEEGHLAESLGQPVGGGG